MAGDSKAERERRLAEALRANLPRRKTAVRGRAEAARPTLEGNGERGSPRADGEAPGETSDTAAARGDDAE